MGTNLRLGDELTDALRAASQRTGMSQQEIIRAALATRLGLVPATTDMQRALDSGAIEAADPLEDVEPTLTLPPGSSSLDLLERDDR